MKDVRQWLQEINSQASAEKFVQKGLSATEQAAIRQSGFTIYSGKVREVLRRDKELLIFHTDRLSAFDRFIGHVPFKGVILAAMSEFWFETVKGQVPSHYKGRPQDRVLRVDALEPVKAEIIVRGYMAGSMLRTYEKGERLFCGQRLPDGLKPYRPLPMPIITPTTKAAAFEHDVDASRDELIAAGVVTAAEWEQLSHLALKLFAIGEKIYAAKGWILVDTKYEFGRTESGELKVIDEIHTPDSSRLWVKETYEARLGKNAMPDMLDKENVRRFLLEAGFSGHGPVPDVPVNVLIDLAKVYLGVYETLVEKPLRVEKAGWDVTAVGALLR